MSPWESLQRSTWCAAYSAAGFVCAATGNWGFAIGAWILALVARIMP